MWKRLARLFLRLTGWEAEGARPVERRFVLIAAPHTSNWDLAFLLAFAQVFDLRISWMGKHTLFRPPLGALMRRVGGLPVVRHRKGDMVGQMAEAFAERDALALVVPAEGTRDYTAHWKSGFYHIALRAGVPIVMGYLDYARKRGGFGPALHPTGDVRADMDEIRDFYSDKVGLYPEKFGEVRLKEEM
ncbi:MAG: lysophospholipid acyltransferase family protein [Myxococcota bacterium]|nr:lysophospholipid acyltransferase family protein [Myxococcota bacterium]